MDKYKMAKIINWICYILAVVEFLLFYGLKRTDFFYAKLSLQIFLVLVSLLSVIPLFFKDTPRKDKIRQGLLLLFFVVGLVSTMFL